jgi:hypothetical protein
MSFGQGTVTLAYRPIPFDGTFEATKVLLAMGFGEQVGGAGKPIEPLPSSEPDVPCTRACPSQEPLPNGFDGLPEMEVLDLATGTWRRLPHMNQGTSYSLTDPKKYVDPSTGTIQVRFVNERSDGVGMSFSLSLEGNVR